MIVSLLYITTDAIYTIDNMELLILMILFILLILFSLLIPLCYWHYLYYCTTDIINTSELLILLLSMANINRDRTYWDRTDSDRTDSE